MSTESTTREVKEALITIRRFAFGILSLHDAAIQAYELCVARGIPVERHLELLFMQEVDRPDPDLLKRKIYRLRLRGMRLRG